MELYTRLILLDSHKSTFTIFKYQLNTLF